MAYIRVGMYKCTFEPDSDPERANARAETLILLS